MCAYMHTALRMEGNTCFYYLFTVLQLVTDSTPAHRNSGQPLQAWNSHKAVAKKLTYQ